MSQSPHHHPIIYLNPSKVDEKKYGLPLGLSYCSFTVGHFRKYGMMQEKEQIIPPTPSGEPFLEECNA